MLNRPLGHRERKMLGNQPPKYLLERLASVDNKLEQLLTLKLLIEKKGPAKIPPKPSAAYSPAVGAEPFADAVSSSARRAGSAPANPGRGGTAISPLEADTILQKVQKINIDAELLERVIKLEKQNRKITILGSMFMTLVILIIAAFAVLMVQGRVFPRGVVLNAWPKAEPFHLSSGEEVPLKNSPQKAESLGRAHDDQGSGAAGQVSAPEAGEAAASTSDPDPAKAAAPVTYVGSLTSNKYHYPDCKWAAQIKPHKLRTFSSVAEARAKGYIPCPGCRPPRSEGEELSVQE